MSPEIRRKLEEAIRWVEKASGHPVKGASAAELEDVRKRWPKEFGYEFPEAYAEFLVISNGVSYSDGMGFIYRPDLDQVSDLFRMNENSREYMQKHGRKNLFVFASTNPYEWVIDLEYGDVLAYGEFDYRAPERRSPSFEAWLEVRLDEFIYRQKDFEIYMAASPEEKKRMLEEGDRRDEELAKIDMKAADQEVEFLRATGRRIEDGQ